MKVGHRHRLAQDRRAVHLLYMRERTQPPIEAATDPNGTHIYRVGSSPAGLPPVRSGDLADAWVTARQAAAAAIWGVPRFFRFRPDDGEPVDLALIDDDAACWAEALDRNWSLQSVYGLSLCLRLLGLVDLLAVAPWVRAFCPVSRAGASLDASLVRAVATLPLTARGSLDEVVLRDRLLQRASPALTSRLNCSGASA